MDKDIAPGLIEKVNKDFDNNIKNDRDVTALNEKLAAGQAKYEDAYKYAESVGTARSKALSEISAASLPEGKMHYNIASRLLSDSLTTDHEMVADYAAGVQKSYNDKAGIHLKALKVDVNQDRIDGFVEGVCNADNFDDVKWKFGEPVVTHSRSVVDDTIKKNAEFQSKAGITATVTRRAAPRCCDWCTDLEGEYTYPGVPGEVFQRHDNCKCTVDYNGKKLKAYGTGEKAHTFRDPDEERRSGGSSGSGRSAQDRKDWHGYGSKKAYVNRFAEQKNQEKNVRQNLRLSMNTSTGNGETIRRELGYIDPERTNQAIAYFREEIRNEKIEHAIVIDENGKVVHFIGGADGVDLFNVKLDNAHILHNHPDLDDILSFGKDDFGVMQENQSAIYELCNPMYNYRAEIIKDLSEVSYSKYYDMSLKVMKDGDDMQDVVMQLFSENGYIKYDKKRFK